MIWSSKPRSQDSTNLPATQMSTLSQLHSPQKQPRARKAHHDKKYKVDAFYYVPKNKTTSINNQIQISDEIINKSRAQISKPVKKQGMKKYKLRNSKIGISKGVVHRGRPGPGLKRAPPKEKKFILDSNFNLDNSPFKAINKNNIGKIEEDGSLFQVKSFKSLHRLPKQNISNKSGFLPAIKKPRQRKRYRQKRFPKLEKGGPKFERNPYHPDEENANPPNPNQQQVLPNGSSTVTQEYLNQFKKGFQGVRRRQDRFRMISLNKKKKKWPYRSQRTNIDNMLIKGSDLSHRDRSRDERSMVKKKKKKKGRRERPGPRDISLAKSAQFHIGQLNGKQIKVGKNELQISNFLVWGLFVCCERIF